VGEAVDGVGFEETLAVVRDVVGCLTDEQAKVLYERAANLPPSARIVEIGSYHGRSTILLANAAPQTEVIAIDPYAGVASEPRKRVREKDVGVRELESFRANLDRAGVGARVRHIRDFSTDALRGFEGEVDLLFVDGAHDLRTALSDIRGWGALVTEGGVMLIHDSFSSVGVTLAQLMALLFGKSFRYVGRTGSLTEYRRETVYGRPRVRNVVRQTTAMPWFARNLLVKLALVARAKPLARLLGHSEDVFPY
jgi:predicted O-methyltransferase YrrM